MSNAEKYLAEAQAQMRDRAASRDTPTGERSMARAVAAFNSLYGHSLTETEGWQFMSILKKARGAQGTYREDDYIDDVAYAALAAESASGAACKQKMSGPYEYGKSRNDLINPALNAYPFGEQKK